MTTLERLPVEAVPTTRELCRFEDCTRPRILLRTICNMHDTRIKRHGDPEFNTWTVADEVTVDQAVAGRRVMPGMTRLELRLLGLRLAERGLTVPEIARVLDVTERTVYRWRSARPVPARPAAHPTPRKVG
jgi:hypothetical protein